MDSQMLCLVMVQMDMMFGDLLKAEVVLMTCGVGLFLVLIPLVVIWARGDRSVQELRESLRKN